MNHYLAPNWPAPKNIKAYTTLRFGGNSKAPYESFNLHDRGEDNPHDVALNRQQLCNELGLDNKLVWLSQVHGTTVIATDKGSYKTTPEADAAFSSTPNIPCAVLTADCLPILLCNNMGTQVAAIHAGWRGLHAGIIEETAKHLMQPMSNWMAWLGPAISSSCFEVGEDVYTYFVDKNPENKIAFQPKTSGKWMADLYLLARLQLVNLGITNIYGGQYCTYTDSEKFYSFRRSQGKTGRMASLIWIDHTAEEIS